MGEDFDVISYRWISYGRGLFFVLERAGWLAVIRVCAAAPGSRLGH